MFAFVLLFMRAPHIVYVPCKDGVVILVELPSEDIAPVDKDGVVVFNHVTDLLAGPKCILIHGVDARPRQVLHHIHAWHSHETDHTFKSHGEMSVSLVCVAAQWIRASIKASRSEISCYLPEFCRPQLQGPTNC